MLPEGARTAAAVAAVRRDSGSDSTLALPLMMHTSVDRAIIATWCGVEQYATDSELDDSVKAYDGLHPHASGLGRGPHPRDPPSPRPGSKPLATTSAPRSLRSSTPICGGPCRRCKRALVRRRAASLGSVPTAARSPTRSRVLQMTRTSSWPLRWPATCALAQVQLAVRMVAGAEHPTRCGATR